jgi:hypothetical protein
LIEIGDRVEIKALKGTLRLTGEIRRMGVFIFFVSERNWPFDKPFVSFVSLEQEKLLHLNHHVDETFSVTRIEK